MYEKLPPVPDHPALEHAILELWEREETFQQLREQIRGGEPFSFTAFAARPQGGASR